MSQYSILDSVSAIRLSLICVEMYDVNESSARDLGVVQ